MPWNFTLQAIRPNEGAVSDLTFFWQRIAANTCPQALKVSGQGDDFLVKLWDWYEAHKTQLQNAQIVLRLKQPIRPADLPVIREALNKIAWVDRFFIVAENETETPASKSPEEMDLERQAHEVVIRNRLLTRVLRTPIHDKKFEGRNFWDVFIEQVFRASNLAKNGNAVDAKGAHFNDKELIEATGRQGMAAYIRYVLQYSDSERFDPNFGLNLDCFLMRRQASSAFRRIISPVVWTTLDLLHLIREEQEKPPPRPLSHIKVSFSTGEEAADHFDMRNTDNQSAFQQFLLDNRLLPQVFIRLTHIPQSFLDWLKANVISTEILGVEPSLAEEMRGIAFFNRKEQAKSTLRRLIERPVAAETQAVAVERVARGATGQVEQPQQQLVLAVASDTSIRRSKLAPTKPFGMHIVHVHQQQAEQGQSQQQAQSRAVQQRLNEMAQETQGQASHLVTEIPKERLFSDVSENYRELGLSEAEYRSFWKAWVYDHDLFNYGRFQITESAFRQLMQYQAHFCYGLPPLDNLPQGFYPVSYADTCFRLIGDVPIDREIVQKFVGNPEQVFKDRQVLLVNFTPEVFELLKKFLDTKGEEGLKKRFTPEIKTVLCYNPTLSAREDANPLTLRLRDRLKKAPPETLPALNARYLNLTPENLQARFRSAKTIDAQLMLFLDLMTLEDPVMAETIKKDEARKSLLKEILLHRPTTSAEEAPLMREWAWLLHAGCVGVKVLLDKLQAMSGSKPYFIRKFIETYIQTSENLTEFLTEEALSALDRLATSTEPQHHWWEVLVDHDSATTPLEDSVDAFVYFRGEYQRLSGDSDLPRGCSVGYDGSLLTGWVGHVGNLPVALDRLLFILRKSTRCYRSKQQFDEGLSLNLSLNGDYFSSRYDGVYSFSSRSIGFVSRQRFAEYYSWYREHLYKPLSQSGQSVVELQSLKLDLLKLATTGRAFIEALGSGVSFDPLIHDFIETRYSDDPAAQQYLATHPYSILALNNFLSEEELEALKSVVEAHRNEERWKIHSSSGGAPYLNPILERIRSFKSEEDHRKYQEARFTFEEVEFLKTFLNANKQEALSAKLVTDRCVRVEDHGSSQDLHYGSPEDLYDEEILEKVWKVFSCCRSYKEPDAPHPRPTIADIVALSKWYQLLPKRGDYPYYEAYLKGEISDDELLPENPLDAAEHFKIPEEELSKRVQENRLKRAALGLQHELSDELYYNLRWSYSGVSNESIFSWLRDLIDTGGSDAYGAMRHFSERLQQCRDDRAKFNVHYQMGAAKYILLDHPKPIQTRDSVELLARSLFEDEPAREWAKQRAAYKRSQDHSSAPQHPKPADLMSLSALNGLSESNLSNLLQALRKVSGFKSASLSQLAEFNEFIGAFFTELRSVEAIEEALQTRFNLKIETPNPVVMAPQNIAGIALKLAAQSLALLSPDQPARVSLAALIGEDSVQLFIHTLSAKKQANDGSGALENFMQLISAIHQIPMPLTDGLMTSFSSCFSDAAPTIAPSTKSEISVANPHVWEIFKTMPLGQQMVHAFIDPYTAELTHKVRELSCRNAAVLSKLDQCLRYFIAGGQTIKLESLTSDLLNGYEKRREKAEALIALLMRIPQDSDREAVISLVSSYRELWFTASLTDLLVHFTDQFQMGRAQPGEVSGLLERVLENLPPKGDYTPELHRRIEAASAITHDFSFTEAEDLLDLTVEQLKLKREDIEHLRVVRMSRVPELIYPSFLALYKKGKVALAQQVFALNHIGVLYPLIYALNQDAPSRQLAAAEALLAVLFERGERGHLDEAALSIMMGAYLVTPKDPQAELADVPPSELIEQLNALTVEKRNAIARLYVTRPMPCARLLRAALVEPDFDVVAFQARIETDPDGKREAHWTAYDRSKNLARAQTAVGEIERLQEKEKRLSFSLQDQLDLDLRYIYAIQNDLPKGHPIKAMTKAEIHRAFIECRALLTNAATLPQDRHLAQLRLLALSCEVHYRTTGQFPYSTQILSALMMLHDSRDLMLQINTGEGKTLTSVLMATLLWASHEPHAVDICSANMALAESGFRDYQDFFQYVGVECALISTASAEGTYCQDGINFSSVSELSLYRSRTNALKALQEERRPKSVSLILDESDKILDERIKYQFAMASGVEDYSWIYPSVNAFIDSDGFRQPVSREQDVVNLKQFIRRDLQKHAKSHLLLQLDRFEHEQLDKWNDRLDRWIESACEVNTLEIDKDYVIELEEVKGRWVLVAHIFEARSNPKSRWSDGVHQLLHERLNRALERKDPAIMAQATGAFQRANRRMPKDVFRSAAFPIEPELQCVETKTPESFLSFYRHYKGHDGEVYQARGRIIGLTATPGSDAEQREFKSDEERFTLYKIPPHQPSQRQDLPVQVEKNERAQQAAILRVLEAHGNQPILIHCDTIEEAEQMFQFLQQEKGKGKLANCTALQLVDGRQKALEPEAELIKKAGQNGTITISRIFSRGTDIKPTHPLGLVVIAMDPLSKRANEQLRGRAGRQGQKGETFEIISGAKYPTLKGKKGKALDKEIEGIRHKVEEADEARRKYKTRQADVIVDALSQQFDRWSRFIHAIWDRKREQVPELEGRGIPHEAVPENKDLAQSLLAIKAELLDRLSPLWARILEEARGAAAQRAGSKEVTKIATTDPYYLLGQKELAQCVQRFRQEAYHFWQATQLALQNELPKEDPLSSAEQEKQTALQDFQLPENLNEVVFPTPPETPSPPATPASAASSVSIDSAAPSTLSCTSSHSVSTTKSASSTCSHLSSFVRESSSSVVFYQLSQGSSHLEQAEKEVLIRDSLLEQFDAILNQAISEKMQSLYAQLLGPCRQKDDFVDRLSQLITNARGDVRAHPEHLEIVIRDYYRGVARLLQDQCYAARDLRTMPVLFAVLLLPLMRMVDSTQHDVLKRRVREEFLKHVHVFDMTKIRGADQYIRYLAKIGDSVKFSGWETDVLRELMIAQFRQYSIQKIAPDRKKLVAVLTKRLGDGEPINSVLGDGLEQLLKDDQEHHRDHSKLGRCYKLLVHCQQLLQTHGKEGKERKDAAVSVITFFEEQREQQCAKESKKTLSSKYQRIDVARPFIGVVG